MKSGKSKLITTLFAFILSIGALSFGVYAAVSATLNASGTVTFNAYGIDVDVDGSITGAVDTGITTYAGTTNKTRQPSKVLISSNPWNFGNLVFDESTAMNIDEIKISFEIKISNYSNFPIEANVTVPSITGLTITKEDVWIIDAYNSTIGANQQSILVTLSPISYDTPVNLANFNLTINILKTMNVKETDISKFIWSTPANGEISITGNNFTSTDINIIIPSKNGSNRVTSISSYAFSSCSALTSITIPATVTSIGDNAFSPCSALASVYFESTTTFTSLGEDCFKGLKSGSVLYFKNQTVMNQFVSGSKPGMGHYTSSNTTKALY